jgi:hypothetical protein
MAANMRQSVLTGSDLPQAERSVKNGQYAR